MHHTLNKKGAIARTPKGVRGNRYLLVADNVIGRTDDKGVALEWFDVMVKHSKHTDIEVLDLKDPIVTSVVIIKQYKRV